MVLRIFISVILISKGKKCLSVDIFVFIIYVVLHMIIEMTMLKLLTNHVVWRDNIKYTLK